MTKYGLLIFDLDGTLFRAETVTVPAVRMSFQDQGLPVPTDKEIHSFFGRPVGEFRGWVRSRCPNGIADELMVNIDRLELALISKSGELYPGVLEVLAVLRESVANMAICTNGTHEYVRMETGVHGLAPFFDAIAYPRTPGDGKPSMVRDILEELKGRPTIVIGDRGDDIEAAHKNGIPAVAAKYGYGTAEELATADAVAYDPSELPDIIRPLLNASDDC